jgi:hypothetical protein
MMIKPLTVLLMCVSLVRAELPDSVISPGIEVRAVRLSDAVTIDGRLTEPVWQNELGVSKFTQREPVEGGQPTERTTVRVAYDDAAVYVGARMHDRTPDSIIARLGRRDVSTSSDRFNVYIDSYHDKRSGFYFSVNAAGTFYDGVMLNDDWDDDTWDGVWEGKVTTDDQGWTAELRIPFSQLRFRNEATNVWGINFSRTIARRNERDFVVFTPLNGSGFVSRFVDLVGIDNITPPRQLEVLPYITTKAEYLQHAPSDPFVTGSKYTPRIGGDLKFGLGSNLTLNATVNPDFGQVEVDPAVVNLSDVETFFQEKRPFFVEGSNIFEFGSGGTNNNWGFNFPNPTFLYTRRIGRAPQGSVPTADFSSTPSGTDILGATKLTGKIGDNWNIGTIQALTAREYAELETAGQRSQGEVEPMTYYGIERAQKEFDNGAHALGFISTAAVRKFDDDRLRDEISSNALTLGADGWTTLDSEKTWVLAGWAMASNVAGNPSRMLSLQQSSRHYFQRPDESHVSIDSSASSLTGYAARFRLNKQKGDFYMNAALGVIDPKFDVNDVGFLSRSDVINGHLVASYRWSQPKDFYRYIELGGSAFRSYDFAGNRIWDGLFHFGYIEFPNFYSIDWNFAYNPQTISNRRTRGGPLTLTPPGYQVNLSARTNQNSSVVFNAGMYTYQADYQRFNEVWGGVEWRPVSNLSVSFTPDFIHDFEKSQYVGTYGDPLATATFGKRYVFAELDQNTFSAGIRLNWTFSPQLSLQMYIQPLIAAGDYTNFKELAQSRSYDFNRYGDGASTFDPATYVADPDGSGPAPPIALYNPNFNLKSIRGNAVLRWEYFSGSTLYFVWTQTRSDFENIGEFQFSHSMSHLFDSTPDNIFLIKMSYWWSL